MGKKPIKRSLEIMPLSREHHFSLLFSWKINQGLKKGIPVDRIVRYVTYFWGNNLRLHFEQEEAVLFRQFKEEPMVALAHSEHQTLEGMIHSLRSGKGNDAERKQLLNQLSALISSHVRMEERVLFPKLESLMTEEELKRASKVLSEVHSMPIKDNYEDEFWLK